MKLKTILLLSFVVLFSCSDDDEQLKCEATEVLATINGEAVIFEPTGYGISMIDGGHELTLWFGEYTNQPNQRNMIVKLRYKRTGKNKIESMRYSHSLNGNGFSGEMVNQNFKSNVSINRSSCFLATFSADAIANGDHIIITDGKISYEYEEPFGQNRSTTANR